MAQSRFSFFGRHVLRDHRRERIIEACLMNGHRFRDRMIHDRPSMGVKPSAVTGLPGLKVYNSRCLSFGNSVDNGPLDRQQAGRISKPGEALVPFLQGPFFLGLP